MGGRDVQEATQCLERAQGYPGVDDVVVMARLYEWEVRVGDEHDISSCGVTDKPFRACGHMLRVLADAPRGTHACGHVTAIKLAPQGDHYDRLQTIVELERYEQGAIRGFFPFKVAKTLTHEHRASGRARPTIDMRRAGR